MTLNSDAKFKEKQTRCFKNDKSLVNFDPNTQKSHEFALSLALIWKVFNVWTEKYRGVIFHHTKVWFKIREKLICHLENGIRNLANFYHWKVTKLDLWWDPFVKSRKCMSLNFTEELCHDNENDSKIEEELPCRFKIDMRSFANFDPSIQKSPKLAR